MSSWNTFYAQRNDLRMQQQQHYQAVERSQRQAQANSQRIQVEFQKANERMEEYNRIQCGLNWPVQPLKVDGEALRMTVWIGAKAITTALVVPFAVHKFSGRVAATVICSTVGYFFASTAIECYRYDPASSRKSSVDELGRIIMPKIQDEPVKPATEGYYDSIRSLFGKAASYCSGWFAQESEPRIQKGEPELPIYMSIKFREMFFNVEMLPTLNGKAVNPTERMREVERQKQVFTKMVQEMARLHEPDYMDSLGQIQGLTDEGFIFERGTMPHGEKTTDLWKKFLETLEKPLG